MAYDEKLAARLDAALRDRPGFEPRNMFGSIGWFLRGNMCVGTWKDSLVVRCAPTDWSELRQKPGVGEFDITGKSMKGWLLVGPEAIRTSAGLDRWLETAQAFVGTLPPKPKKPTAPAKTRQRIPRGSRAISTRNTSAG